MLISCILLQYVAPLWQCSTALTECNVQMGPHTRELPTLSEPTDWLVIQIDVSVELVSELRKYIADNLWKDEAKKMFTFPMHSIKILELFIKRKIFHVWLYLG